MTTCLFRAAQCPAVRPRIAFLFRLVPANHRLVGAYYRLVAANHRLAAANNDTIRKGQRHISSCCTIYWHLVAIYQRQKKRLGRKGNENKRAGKIITTERFADKQDAKKTATASRMIGRKACDRQLYAIIYKRYGSKMGRSMALQQHSERAWPDAPRH